MTSSLALAHFLFDFTEINKQNEKNNLQGYKVDLDGKQDEVLLPMQVRVDGGLKKASRK